MPAGVEALTPRMTPRMSPQRPLHGQVTVWNRELLGQIKNLEEDLRLDEAHQENEERIRRPQKQKLAFRVSEDSLEHPVSRSRKAKSRSPSHSPRSRKEHAKRRAAARQAVERVRLAEEDEHRQRDVLERVDKQRERRDAYFNRLVENVAGAAGEKFNADISVHVRDWSRDQYRVACQLCDQWTTRCFEPIQGKVNAQLQKLDLDRQRTPRSTGLATPRGAYKDPGKVHVGIKDPLKHALMDQAAEAMFQRLSDRVLKQKPLELVDLHSQFREPCMERYLTRPTLEPAYWDSGRINGTPYGHFAKVCADTAAGARPHSLLKRGNFVPDEADGVAAAGKRRTRWAYNDVGILRGNIVRDGEAMQYQNNVGAGHGAPLQDHYTFQVGSKVTDNEFPRGKKIWNPTPGNIPRGVLLEALGHDA